MKSIRFGIWALAVSFLVVGATIWANVSTEFAPSFTKSAFNALPAHASRLQIAQSLGQPLEELHDGDSIILRYSKPKSGAMGYWCYELILHADHLFDKRSFLFWD